MYFRTRRFNGDGRIRHRKRLGKREMYSEAPEHESKLKIIMRPLGFTLMVTHYITKNTKTFKSIDILIIIICNEGGTKKEI